MSPWKSSLSKLEVPACLVQAASPNLATFSVLDLVWSPAVHKVQGGEPKEFQSYSLKEQRAAGLGRGKLRGASLLHPGRSWGQRGAAVEKQKMFAGV